MKALGRVSINLLRGSLLLFEFIVFTVVDEGKAQEIILLDLDSPEDSTTDNRNFHLYALQVLVPLISCGFLFLGILYCLRALICKPFYLDFHPTGYSQQEQENKTFRDVDSVTIGNEKNEELSFDTRILMRKESCSHDEELLDIRIT